jgi:hypothetical protein
MDISEYGITPNSEIYNLCVVLSTAMMGIVRSL